MRTAISIADLQKYAEKLPRRVAGSRYDMAICPHIPSVYYNPSDPMPMWDRVEYSRITFHQRPARIDGVEVTAWYYHDILVKVCV